MNLLDPGVSKTYKHTIRICASPQYQIRHKQYTFIPAPGTLTAPPLKLILLNDFCGGKSLRNQIRLLQSAYFLHAGIWCACPSHLPNFIGTGACKQFYRCTLPQNTSYNTYSKLEASPTHFSTGSDRLTTCHRQGQKKASERTVSIKTSKLHSLASTADCSLEMLSPQWRVWAESAPTDYSTHTTRT